MNVLSFYSLNNKIDSTVLIGKFRNLRRVGYDTFVLHARCGLDIPYLGKQWFDMIRATVIDARKNGYKIILYDEFGWPSGFADGKIVACGKQYAAKLLMHSDVLTPDVRENLIASYKKNDNDIQLCADSNAANYFIYYKNINEYVDLAYFETVDRFIETVYEKYYTELKEYFGKEIVGFFTDEPAMLTQKDNPFPWSVGICEEFSKNCGYPLKDNLWKLFSWDRAFVYDYRMTLAKMFFSSFTKKLAKWCEEHGVKLTGHLSSEDSVRLSFSGNGSCAYNYKYFQMPGIDFLGNRSPSPVLMRQLTSVARQYGKKELLSECFGASGYNCSLETYEYIWNYHAAYGVNLSCHHISQYSIEGRRKRDFPLFFSESMNGFDNLSLLNEKIRFLNRFSYCGESTAEVLVLSPLTSCYAYHFEDIESRGITTDYRLLLDNLDNRQIQYDLGDEFLLEEDGSVENGKIGINGIFYRLLIIPQILNIKKTTLDLLEKFVQGGGIVLRIGYGRVLCDFRHNERCDTFFSTVKTLFNTKGNISLYFNRHYPYAQKVQVINASDSKTADGLLLNVREDEKNVYALVFNKEKDYIKDLRIVFSYEGNVRKEEMSGSVNCTCANTLGESVSKISLRGGEVGVYVLEKGAKPTSYEENTKTEVLLYPTKVLKAEDNTLVIDKAEYALNGGDYSSEMNAIEINDVIYNTNSSNLNTVRVKYSFYVDEGAKVHSIFAESEKAQGITLNGVELIRSGEFWIDESFVGYTAKPVCTGKNEIVISYSITPSKKYGDDDFETVKNSFCYNTEIENVYVKGDFGVISAKIAETTDRVTYDGDFRLVQSEPLNCRFELAKQHNPFYRGVYRYYFTYTRNTVNKNEILRAEQFNASSISVFVNGQAVGALLGSRDTVNISEQLKCGENEIIVDLYTKDENLFGPFHHKWGKTSIIGPNSFECEFGIGEYYETKAYANDLHTDKYNFGMVYLNGLKIVSFE